MNKARREALTKIRTAIEDAKGNLETCRDEEQDYYDGMPQNFQDGDKGYMAQIAVDRMSEAADSLDEAVGQIDEAMS